MFNSANKRPTVTASGSTKKSFNSSTTHPASIPSMSGGNSTQKKEHVTQASTGEGELSQSGGGGGGGTGAGSMSGGAGDGEKDLDDVARQEQGKGKGKGIDSSKIHPGSIGNDGQKQKGGKRDSKL